LPRADAGAIDEAARTFVGERPIHICAAAAASTFPVLLAASVEQVTLVRVETLSRKNTKGLFGRVISTTTLTGPLLLQTTSLGSTTSW
jgi:hypothetical protein